MTLRTDSLTQSLPQKGPTMARKKSSSPAGYAKMQDMPSPGGMPQHAASLGATAHAAMSAPGNVMNFNIPGSPSVHEDFTPRAYRSKPNPKG